jgi:hypothetical protein
MRTLKLALVLVVPVVWVAAARSADEDAPTGTTAELLLLRQKSVQQELKLSPEVVRKVLDFTEKESEAYWQALKGNKDELQKKSDELEKEEKKFLEDNLSAEQIKRLDQITWQVTALRQLQRPEVARALKLTEEQQAKFKEMHKEAHKELEAILTAKDKEGRNEKLAKLREDTDQKIEAVLTDEQRAKAKEFVGEPFKGELVIEEP